MKQFSHFRWFVLGAILFGFALVLAPQLAKPLHAASVTIDAFGDTQTVSQSSVGTNNGCVAASVPGGQRDVSVQVTQVGASTTASLIVNGGGVGRLAHDQGTDVKSIATINYDGDCDGGVLDPTGISPAVDLVSSSPANTAVVFALYSSDLSTFLKVRVWTSATACSYAQRTLTSGWLSGSVPGGIIFRFTDFQTDTGAGCTAGATFTSVGAIQFISDGTLNAAADVSVDTLQSAPVDYGDLPQSGYNSITRYTVNTTTWAVSSNGAAHPIDPGLYIGSVIDSENNGQQGGSCNTDSTCDDVNGTPDDEDGVYRKAPDGPWTDGTSHTLRVITTGTGCLSAWIDWDGSASMGDVANESILTNQAVTGSNTATDIPVTVPSGSVTDLYARFRLFPRQPDGSCPATSSPLPPDGQYMSGEVEDYYITNSPTALALASFSGKAQGDKVNLKWETGSELNTLGFNVWRKQGKAGWKQLNADMIAAKNPGNISGNKYNFTDANKKAGKTYKYKLQVLSADGSSSWTKVLKVRVSK